MKRQSVILLPLKFLLTTFLVIGSSLVFIRVSMATQESTGSPKMVVESKMVDIGLVRPGDKVQGVFVIRNEGNADLELIKVAPT